MIRSRIKAVATAYGDVCTHCIHRNVCWFDRLPRGPVMSFLLRNSIRNTQFSFEKEDGTVNHVCSWTGAGS